MKKHEINELITRPLTSVLSMIHQNEFMYAYYMHSVALWNTLQS